MKSVYFYSVLFLCSVCSHASLIDEFEVFVTGGSRSLSRDVLSTFIMEVEEQNELLILTKEELTQVDVHNNHNRTKNAALVLSVIAIEGQNPTQSNAFQFMIEILRTPSLVTPQLGTMELGDESFLSMIERALGEISCSGHPGSSTAISALINASHISYWQNEALPHGGQRWKSAAIGDLVNKAAEMLVFLQDRSEKAKNRIDEILTMQPSTNTEILLQIYVRSYNSGRIPSDALAFINPRLFTPFYKHPAVSLLLQQQSSIPFWKELQ